jgi:hypothetical protein
MRTRNLEVRQRLIALLRRGPVRAADLARQLDVSARTVLRLFEELGADICRGGATGRTRYAACRPLRGSSAPIPLFHVDADGRLQEGGGLRLLQPDGAWCALDRLGFPVDDEARDGWWPGLPYPLYDMQPQGYLGRQFARQLHLDLEVPDDPRDWGDDEIAWILSRRGADLPGHLMLGEQAARLWQAEVLAPTPVLAESTLLAAYHDSAERSVSLGIAGSSAAGEFPKFLSLREHAGQRTPHVLVKFSGVGESSRRWSDLLVCEHLALGAAAGLSGVEVAQTRILASQGRTFLESERFDRLGRFGRLPVVSLQAVSGHLLGLGARDWREHARALVEAGFLSSQHAASIDRLWWFGRLIANGDMHLGNCAFRVADGRLTPAPAYDMVPMDYAPLPGGELPTKVWQPPLPLPGERPIWLEACRQALVFWSAAAGDSRISEPLRKVFRDNANRLEDAAGRV